MIKRIVLLSSVFFAVLCVTGVQGAVGANDEPGGGQYPKLCYVDTGGGWILTPNC